MMIYGNVAGFDHREQQPPPDAFCAICGKPLGKGWGRAFCERCRKPPRVPAPRFEPPPAGMFRCHMCRRDKPLDEFRDAKGRRRVCCAECRRRAAAASAKYKARKREEGR